MTEKKFVKPVILLVIIPAIISTITSPLTSDFLPPIYSTEIPQTGMLFEIYPAEIIYIFLILVYGLFPIKYIKTGRFEEYAKNKTREYQLVKKVLSFEIPILVVLATFYFLWFSEVDPIQIYLPTEVNELPWAYLSWYMINLVYVLSFAVMGGLLWIGVNHINKEFNFYLAKGSFENIAEKNEVSKLGHAKRGLKYYNRYWKEF